MPFPSEIPDKAVSLRIEFSFSLVFSGPQPKKSHTILLLDTQ